MNTDSVETDRGTPEGNVRGDLLARHVLRLKIGPGLIASPSGLVLENTGETPGNPRDEKGTFISQPIFYFSIFLFCLYLWFVAYAAYISLFRVFSS